MPQHHAIVEEDLQYIVSSFDGWQAFKNKVIFVSGANGFLPSYMIFAILKADDLFKLNVQVIGLVRNKEKAERKFAGFLGKNFSLLVQDVSSPIQVEQKIDFIVHAASQASPKYYGIDPVGTLNANVLGTHYLLTLAKQHAVESFLFFSTSEVYGQVDEKYIPTNEMQYGYLDVTNVRACYAESKRLGETMCASWHAQYQVPAKMVRPFHTYGPGMELNDGRVYADFVSNILGNKNIGLKSDGSAKRAFCYLADAVVGFFLVLTNGKNGEAYNVGNPDAEISIYELAILLSAMFPEREIKVTRELNENSNYLQSSVSRNSPDITKLKTLGWNPKSGIEEGFLRTIKSYL
jgi:UDP-glucuronate decarboxylase